MQPQPTVFVVDDDDAVRESIIFLLESVNLAVEGYASAEAYLDSYQPDRAGCLVLDISMPGMSGLELQEILQAQQIRIPIIFITGHGDVPMSVRALKAGALDFIEKPFNKELLLSRINDALAWDLEIREEQARKVAEAVRTYADSIVETVREPLLVFDEQLQLLSANRSFYKTFQIPLFNDEVPVLTEFAQTLWNIAGLKQKLEEVVAKNAELHDFEIAHSFLEVGQKVLRLNACQLRQPADQAKRFLLAMEDITQRKRAEERSRVLLESTPDAMVVVNENGEIILANKQIKNIFGYTMEELVGQPVEVLLPERSRGQHVGYRSDYAEKPSAVPMGYLRDISGQHKGGVEFPIEISLSPLDSDEGLLVLAAIRDVTERKIIEKELIQYRDHLEELVAMRTADLEASNRELESYSYSIAHDLRAPLRAIAGFSQILLDDAKDKLEPEDMDALNRIIAAGKNMSQLIDDILELSRITRSELHYEMVDLSKLGNNIVSRLKQSHPDREVVCQIEDNLTVKGDVRLLDVALQNLIENAWKYTRDISPAHIELGKQKQNGEIVYYVKDNGVGFDMEYTAKLFKPFHRLHSAEDFEGTGIGLATVQRVIQRHGGKIWIKAEKNNGATFYFSLQKSSSN
ncbi:MAG: PAS domain S-box protein [Gammaproteobacteria bacterium]|jgi:PAS domain S-box-containing protein